MHPDRMIIQKYTCTPMFIVALFMITRYRSNLNEWIKKMCYVYTMHYHSAVKKNEIMPSGATWMSG